MGVKDLKAEASTEVGASVQITLAGRKSTVTVTVPSILDWGDGAVEALDEFNLRAWAREALSEEDFALWTSAGATTRQCIDAITHWKKATGEDPGESDASQPSSN